MLRKEEIERVAQIKGLQVQNAEKDYLLELLLFLVTREAGKNLVFKGGTALYKLHSLNRFSEDLDFTGNAKTCDASDLSAKVIKKLGSYGVPAKIKAMDVYQNQINIVFELTGPYFDGNPKTMSRIVINISEKEKILYTPEERTVFSQYSDIPSFTVFVMPLHEIFAEKIRALLTREKARDIYDIWFLLQKGVVVKKQDLDKKLKKYNVKYRKQSILARIDALEKSWKTDLRTLIVGQLPDFAPVRKFISEKIES